MKQWDLRGVTANVDEVTERRDRITGSIRVLVDQIPAVLWTTDPDLVFTSSLGSRLSGMGLGPNQLVGTSLPELFETDDYDDEPLRAHRCALRGEPAAFQLHWVDRTYHAQVGPLRDVAGQVVGTICVALDEVDPARVVA